MKFTTPVEQRDRLHCSIVCVEFHRPCAFRGWCPGKPVGTRTSHGILGTMDRATINVRIRIKVGIDLAADSGISKCARTDRSYGAEEVARG